MEAYLVVVVDCIEHAAYSMGKVTMHRMTNIENTSKTADERKIPSWTGFNNIGSPKRRVADDIWNTKYEK